MIEIIEHRGDCTTNWHDSLVLQLRELGPEKGSDLLKVAHLGVEPRSPDWQSHVPSISPLTSGRGVPGIT